MFQTYVVIGSGLSVLGLVYTYYFVRFLLSHKAESFSVIFLSDALVTVFIGVFYIYSAIMLSPNTDKTPVFNFTNNIDDIVTINTESFLDSMPDQITNGYESQQTDGYFSAHPSEQEIDQETGDIIEVGESTDIETGNTSYNAETTTDVQITTAPNEKDDFLTNYQNYIKGMIKQKLSNTSYHNRTVYYNNKEYKSLKSRAKRDVKLESMDTPDDKCFNDIFISNALFLYSFLHCSLTLINNTLLCKKDGNSVTEQTHEDPSAIKDSGSEKNENSVPIGPLFTDSDNSMKSIKDLFKARSAQSQNIGNDKEKVNKKKQNQKLKLITYIVLMWLLPIISIAIFYNILKSENLGTKHSISYLSAPSLNSTQASPELASIIENPANVAPTKESAEVKNILKNVYHIVNEAQQQQNVKREPHYSTSVMMDIIHFLNQKYRNPKDYEENCSIREMSLKIYFLMFIVVYVLVILYAKVKQASVKSQNGKANEKFNVCILAFTFLWLPSVLELFFRMFLTQTIPNILTDIFLTIGNTNRLFTMTVDYAKSKKLINKLSVVEPVV